MGTGSDFLEGMLAPYAPSLAAGVVGGLLGSALWIHALDADWLLTNPGLIATSDGDVGAFGTARVLALSRSEPGEPTVLILGGSAIREAVTSQADLEARLASAGVTARVHLITGLNQHLWQSEAFLALAPDTPGLLVLDLDATQLAPPAEILAWDKDNPRYGVELPILDERLEEAGLKPGPFALRRWMSARTGFLLPRAWLPLARALSGPIGEEPHQYNRAPEKRPSWAYSAFGEYFRAASPLEEAAQLAAAQGVIDRARAKGYHPVLLHHPHDRSYFSPEAVAGMEAGDRMLDRWAVEQGLVWLDPAAEAEIRADELYDWCHIFTPGAEERWTAAFARQLTATWKAM